jgi:endonuclease YncB( thermonuclease family)
VVGGRPRPREAQEEAHRAKQVLSEEAFGQAVELQVVDTDRYGRTVADVSATGVTSTGS